MPKSSTVKIALIQTRVSTDVQRNMKKTAAKIKEAAKKGAQVVCLQELYRSKYFPVEENADVQNFLETVPGESTQLFAALAKQLNLVIIVPIFEADPRGKFFNTAVVIDADGSILGAYRKIHIPHDPFFYEQSYFESGDTGYQVFNTRHLKLGVLICYDQWFPEPARINALKGADVIFYPTAIGHLKGDPLPAKDWISAWTTVQRGHAIANFVHVAVTNRVGTEGDTVFWGGSFVADAFGRVIKTAGSDEEVLIVDADISLNARIREGWRFTKNRKPETYALITEPSTEETPQQLGYFMPAEWAPHQATWLAWPYDPVTFPRRVEKVEQQYVRMIDALRSGERVRVVVRNLKEKSRISAIMRRGMKNLDNVEFHVRDYADVWFRDYGPVFVVNPRQNKIAIVNWVFNAWGGKYKELMKDSQMPYFLSEDLGLSFFKPGVVLEGGAIDVNGAGTLITTEQCLLNENRNPQMTKAGMERYLSDYLGVRHVIWLNRGLVDDDTDGHVDNIARFVSPTTVLCAYEEDVHDANYAALHENFEILKRSRDQDGKPLEVIKVPMPASMLRKVRGRNVRLPASHLNFYIGNGVVLVPNYGGESDSLAGAIIGRAFPGRRIQGIDCRDLVFGAGTLHCITQQQPAV